MTSVRLLIQPVIEQAAALAKRVEIELPTHEGLRRATGLALEAAQKAGRVTERMKRPYSLHRLPVVFLTVAVVALAILVYWQFFRVTTLTLALPDRDAQHFRRQLATNPRLDVRVVDVAGSREAVAQLERGAVDLGFVQGGIPISPLLPRLESPARELVLCFTRNGRSLRQVRRVLTSGAHEGSHSVAEAFFQAWHVPVEFTHTWQQLTADERYVVPDDVDAVFVVKDPSDERTLAGIARLTSQGFSLVAPQLGARVARFDSLAPTVVPRGYFEAEPPLPAEALETFSVTTWLVAREGLTPGLLTQAGLLLHGTPRSIDERSVHLSATETGALFQGVDALLSIIVHVALAFFALLGLDVFAYRRHFHELNSLVSLVSMLQSSKDVLHVAEPNRSENQLYLTLCSDLLGLISAVSGYYTQENSSLLFNTLPEIVHQRCDALKLNIQLKLLHSLIPAPG